MNPLLEKTTVRLVLLGHMPEKKNMRKLGMRNGRMTVYQDVEVTELINRHISQARAQWIPQWFPLAQSVQHPDITVRFHLRNGRSDRDNKLTTLLDILVAAGVLWDDNTRRCNGTITLLPAIFGAEESVEVELTF